MVVSFRRLVAVAASTAALATLLTGGAVVLLGDRAAGTATTDCPAPTGSNAPCVKFGSKKGPVSIRFGTFASVAKLPLGRGKYAIHAKLYVENSPGFGQDAPWSVECKLSAGSHADRSAASLPDNVFGAETSTVDAVIALSVAHRFRDSGAAVVRCRIPGAGVSSNAHRIKITALRLGTLIRVPIT